MFISKGKYHDRDADRTNKIDQWIKDRVIKDRLNIGVSVIVIDVAKTPLYLLLRIEQLHRLGSRQIFLQKGIESSVAGPNPVKPAAGVLAKPVCRYKEKRHGHEGHEGELPVEPEHNADYREYHDQIAEHVDHAGGEQFVQCIDV